MNYLYDLYWSESNENHFLKSEQIQKEKIEFSEDAAKIYDFLRDSYSIINLNAYLRPYGCSQDMILCSPKGTKRRLRRSIMLADTWGEDYKTYIENNLLTLCSGLSYLQRANRLENAQHMNALIIDLNGVGDREMKNLFLRFGNRPEALRALPGTAFLGIN